MRARTATEQQPPIQWQQKRLTDHWRRRVLVLLTAGEVAYNVCRRAFALSTPLLHEEVGLSHEELGAISSAFSLAYTVAKPLSSIASDYISCSRMFSCGLILSGGVQLLIGAGLGVPERFPLLWGLNGIAQGAGWPSAARLMIQWYPKGIRTRYWALVSAATNVGAALGVLALGPVIHVWGWRCGFLCVGFPAVTVGLLTLRCLKDSPAEIGIIASDEDAPITPRESNRGGYMDALRSPTVWRLSFAGFFLYIVMQGVHTWGMLVLVRGKGLSLLWANACFVLFDVGGLVGSLSSGVLPWSHQSLCVCFAAIGIGSLGVLHQTVLDLPPWVSTQDEGFSTEVLIIGCSLFVLGFCCNVPKVLFGIMTREALPLKAIGGGGAMWEGIAELGSSTAGWPIGWVVHNGYSWNDVLKLFAMAMLCVMLLASPPRMPRRLNTLY